jgi:acetyl esterase/lipase
LEGVPQLIENANVALNQDVSPLLIEDEELAKLPSTYVLTVDYDRLRDEGFIYAGRLRANGEILLNDIVKYLKDNL